MCKHKQLYTSLTALGSVKKLLVLVHTLLLRYALNGNYQIGTHWICAKGYICVEVEKAAAIA